MHEMGHAIGLPDSYNEKDRDSLMYGFLTKGERRLPAKGQAIGAIPGSVAGTHFLGSPLSIGTLPKGKSVVVTFTVQIGATTATSISRSAITRARLSPCACASRSSAGGSTGSPGRTSRSGTSTCR